MKAKSNYEQLKHDAMDMLARNRAYFKDGQDNPELLAQISSGIANVKAAESVITGVDTHLLNAHTAINKLPVNEQKEVLQLFKGELNAKTVRGD